MAVTVAEPVSGAPAAVVPLQLTKVESQTPAQTCPEGEMVARLGLEELNVNVVVAAAPFESKAFTCNGSETCPDSRESDAGVRVTWATAFFLLEEPPPQPANARRNRPNTKMIAVLIEQCCIEPQEIKVGERQ